MRLKGLDAVCRIQKAMNMCGDAHEQKGESLEKTKEIHSIYYRRMQLRLKFSPLASAHQDMRLRNVF